MIISIYGRKFLPKRNSKVQSATQLSEKEKTEYRKLTDYIQQLYQQVNTEPPWALFMAQIKDMKKKYGLTYTDMLRVLQYMTQIEEISITNADTLGLLPYYVDRTQKYISDYKSIKKVVDNFEHNENIIKIKPHQQSHRKKNEKFDD